MGKIKIGKNDDECCEHLKPLRKETNILVLVRLNDLKFLRDVNIWLAIGATAYFGVNVVCTVLNSFSRGEWPGEAECTLNPSDCPVTTDQIFHRTEFGTTWLFSIIEVLAIIYSPDRQFEAELLLKFLVFWNVAASFVPAMLVFINLEMFEVPSHQLEYANGFAMAGVDMLMGIQLMREYRKAVLQHQEHKLDPGARRSRCEAPAKPSFCKGMVIPALMGLIPLSVTAAMLAVYNGMGITEPCDQAEPEVINAWTEQGLTYPLNYDSWTGTYQNCSLDPYTGKLPQERNGEQAAHYLEFVFEMISAGITFWSAACTTRSCRMLLPPLLRNSHEPCPPGAISVGSAWTTRRGVNECAWTSCSQVQRTKFSSPILVKMRIARYAQEVWACKCV